MAEQIIKPLPKRLLHSEIVTVRLKCLDSDPLIGVVKSDSRYLGDQVTYSELLSVMDNEGEKLSKNYEKRAKRFGFRNDTDILGVMVNNEIVYAHASEVEHTPHAMSLNFKTPSDYCTVCDHSDIVKIGEVLESLVVMENVKGKYELAFLDGGDHIEQPFHSFSETPQVDPAGDHDEFFANVDLAEELDDRGKLTVAEEAFIERMDEQLDLAEKWQEKVESEIKLIDISLTMNETVQLVSEAVKIGYSLHDGPLFGLWLYNRIGETIERMNQ